MRIAYFANANTPNGFYRGVGPMDNLAHRGHEVRQLSRYKDQARFAAVRDVDVLHVHRSCERLTLRLVREAKAHGAAVVWDNDDDLASFEKGTTAYRKTGALERERTLAGTKAIIGLADLVTAPNAILADRFREFGAARTAVIENHVPGLFLRRQRPARTRVAIGWVAGVEHQLEVERLPIQDALQRLLDERDDVDVVSIGLGLGLRGERYHNVKKVRILELADHTAMFDIGIAPLVDVPFNCARSSIKLKEYAAGGAAWLASPVGPYVGLGEKEGGRLVADDRWHEELTRLLDKPRDLRKLAKRAAGWVADQTLEKNVGHWEAAFADAVAHARRSAE